MSLEHINYGGWPNCYRLSNGVVDLVVTTDVGPRVIRFGFLGDANEFKEYEAMQGQTGGSVWRIYGGHRLWHAPEVSPRTYFPDNSPVRLEEHPNFVRLIQPVEDTTGVQKELDICLSPTRAQAEVVHRLRNCNLWPVELAVWAVSVMAPGGVAIVPLPPRGPQPQNLQPASTIALWAYTKMSDSRWTWGEKYILLRQHAQAIVPQKAGAMVPEGWVGYANRGHLFVVKFDHVQGARYPDKGCSAEVYTDSEMLEIETLGPLTQVEPNAVVEHIERWFLFRDVTVPGNDADVERHVSHHVPEGSGQ